MKTPGTPMSAGVRTTFMAYAMWTQGIKKSLVSSVKRTEKRGVKVNQSIKKIIDKKNRKTLWNTKFRNKVAGRPAELGGLGNSSLKMRLQTSKDYPNVDICAYLNWRDWNKYTKKEKQLIEDLLNQL